MIMQKFWSWILPVLVGVILWFLPHPQGIEADAWHLLAIFVATIVGIILKPLPMGAVAMLGITLTVTLGIVTINQGLSAFGNRVIWLIVIAFFISRGFIKTGLGARIAYRFMSILGKRSLGLAYGMIATDLVLAPAIPSITARSGGVIYPLLRSIARAYGSDPDDGTSRKIGSFLIKASFQGTVITGGMFLTGMAANPLAAKLALEQGVEITWAGWASAALVPGLLSLLIIPWVLFKLYPPEIKETPAAAEMARAELEKMGAMKFQEWIMLFTFVLLLVLWIFGSLVGLHSTTAALIGLGVLLVSKTLTWDDILKEKGAWDTLVWFSALVMMASFLNELGLIPWFGERVGNWLNMDNWLIAFVLLSVIYFYSHYFFASATAHVSAMYLPFLTIALAMGTPPMLAALVLGFFSNLFGGITHYGTGPAPVLFGSGYIDMKDWWRLGGLASVINISVWFVVGGIWWKIIGLW
ncbi:DASS family sodium-coupled anion symporter [candidate division KSB1 bacterium]|nr:DASS family sodium-coupled anion symporter [candidate division KSB1 bacterium]